MSKSAGIHRPDHKFHWRSALKNEFREHLPVWYIYFGSVVMLHVVLINYPDEMFRELDLPRFRFAPAILFQLFIFWIYMGLRIKHSNRIRQKRIAVVILGLLSIGLPASVVFFHRPFPVDPARLKLFVEMQSYICLTVIVVQVLWKRSYWDLILFFGVTSVYGLILENTGIIMGYFFEPGYLIYLGPLPAPLCNVIGWPIVFYIMFSLTERFASWWPWLKQRVWARAITITCLALCFDAQLDPLASLSGILWRWNEALEPAFLGVPMLNFAAWAGAFFPYSWMLFGILDRTDISPGQQSWELFLRVPLASALGGLICFGIMAILENGFDGPTYQILGNLIERLIPY